jgi:hypothetical protein
MDLLLCNLPWENNQICLDSSLTSALVQFNFNKLNKIDYDDDLNSKQVPKTHVLLRRLTSNFDVLYSDAFQVLMKIYSQVNDAFTGEKLAIDSTRFSGKALQRSLLFNETQTLAPLTPIGLPTALCSSVPDVNMFDDLLAKKVLSMELNVLNKPLLVSVNVELSEQPTCGASTSTPWRSLRVRSLMGFLMSPLQRKPRPTILLIKVSKMPQQHDLNQCDHFPMSQLNPSMICQKILLKIHLFLWLIRLLAWTCQRIPVWTYRMSQGAWTWNCATLKSHNPHSKLKQQQRPPAERQVLDLCLNLFRKMFQSLMVMTVKLISPPLQLTTPSPNLQCLRHLHNFLDFPLLNADGNMNEVRLLGCDLHCGHWCMITLILKALAIQSVPSTVNRSTSLWSSFQMAVKAQPTFQLDGTMIRKPMRSTLVPRQIFGALKMDFWLETMFGQGIALFIQQIFPCLPRSSRPQMA